MDDVVKPGKPPAVHRTPNSVRIVMDVAPETSRTPIRLVVRCERDGDIFVSIDRTPNGPDV